VYLKKTQQQQASSIFVYLIKIFSTADTLLNVDFIIHSQIIPKVVTHHFIFISCQQKYARLLLFIHLFMRSAVMHTQMHLQLRLQLTFKLFTPSAVMYTHPRKDDIPELLFVYRYYIMYLFNMCLFSLLLVGHGILGNKKLVKPSYPCVFSFTPRA
jgi:hypothetical protein